MSHRFSLIAGKQKEAGDYLALFALSFYVATQLLFRLSMLPNTFPILVEIDLLGICESVSCGLGIVALVTRPRRLKGWQIALVAIAFAVLLFSAIRINDFRLVHEYILLIAIAGVRLKKVFTVYYVTVLAVVIPIMLLSMTGVIYNRDVIPNSFLVFSFGFGHPNTTAAFLFSAIGAMAYTCWEKKTWFVPLILSAVVAVFAYFLFSSHAASAILVIFAVLLLMARSRIISRMIDNHGAAICGVLIVLPVLLLGVMLVCTAYYSPDNSLSAWFSAAIHGRPEHAHGYYVAQGGFSYLGTENVPVDSYHTGIGFGSVDSGYCYLALVYGLASLFVLFATYVAAVVMMLRKGFHPVALALLFLAVLYLVVESYPLYLAECAAVLWLSEAFVGISHPEESA